MARAALQVLRDRPDNQARTAAERRRHHDAAFQAAITKQEATGIPLTAAERNRSFARVVLATLPALVARIRTVCRQARRLQHDRIPETPAVAPGRRAHVAADDQDKARHRGGYDR